MGRKSAFKSLEPEKQAKALALMRAHRHKSIDDIRAALIDSEDLDISRSAVHRMLSKLNARDQMLASAEEHTVVTVVDRITGEVVVIKTAVPASLIESLIRQAEAVS
ncbi:MULTISPECIES: DUF3486 family protein [Acidovorax]|uniref:Uncharacterized protein n=1 Tax=Acidovorax carolinensis TaxID=553814 RepID=A0A240UBG8_9BURK|nr:MULTISPECIES: DUF3486 family protein [Acidovorax]ART47586.1 hypothetical protein CBP33_05115 [Acidovorax carolinensis]ART55730.1 hypothetical protein CBP35_13380 [Acidovorax carolinensis]ART58402.1 hypothetical protein CBP36_05550 [Acidovorax carolinensis]MBP3982695.1 DUF3486 family protein [Acidovorax sp. JG5]